MNISLNPFKALGYFEIWHTQQVDENLIFNYLIQDFQDQRFPFMKINTFTWAPYIYTEFLKYKQQFKKLKDIKQIIVSKLKNMPL